jgi:lauroyl/myristoyl acyltransferase
VRDFLTYGAYRTVGALAGPLPPRAGYWLSRRIGAILYATSPRMKQILTHNIGHVVGPQASPEEVQALVRQACVNIAKGHYDLFRLSRLSFDEIKALTQVEGYEYVEQALAPGKGVIVVSAHLGNVDILGQVPLAYGVPFMGPVQHTRPERLFQYTLQLRQSHGLRLIPANGVLLEMFRALKRGEIVGLPCDRGIADNSREVEFFGAPARLPDGPIRLAKRTGAVVVPAFGLRLPDDSFLVQIEPPLDLPDSGDPEADIAAGVKMVVEILERYIGQHPEQWLVAAPVWSMNGPEPETRG